MPGVFFTCDMLVEPDMIDGTLNKGYYEVWKDFELDPKKASPQELTVVKRRCLYNYQNQDLFDLTTNNGDICILSTVWISQFKDSAIGIYI